MPRQARLDSPGTLHNVMVRGIERDGLSMTRRIEENFVRRLGALAEENRTLGTGEAMHLEVEQAGTTDCGFLAGRLI